MTVINGKKTYILVAAMWAYAGIGVALGYHDADTAWRLALEGAAIAGLRHGIAKA